jgi:hypothetical protein
MNQRFTRLYFWFTQTLRPVGTKAAAGWFIVVSG